MTNKEEIIRALTLWFQPGDVFEIRALNALSPDCLHPHTASGYFDYEHIAQAADAVGKLRCYSGVYVVINPAVPDLLARSCNRLKRSTAATADGDILSRRWLLIDCDAVRKSGISSTEEEHNAALDLAQTIRRQLTEAGWPDPIMLDSGNGAQMTYRIDLPANDDGLVKRILERIAEASTEQVHVDLTVFNPARLWRLPGTMNCKGDSIPSRPHRMAHILSVPDVVNIVPYEALLLVGGRRKPEEPMTVPAVTVADCGYREPSGFNIDEWISQYAPDAGVAVPWGNGGRKWIFKVCPFNADHTNRSAGIFQHPDGTLGFRCHHNGCLGHDWREFRELREPGCYAIKFDFSGTVDLSAIMGRYETKETQPEPPAEEIPPEQENADIAETFADPGSLPDDLLSIPGFIDEYTEFIMSSAAQPNRVLSFCGAIAFLSYLLGRRVTDERNNRPNIYLISLANSGVGKNHARAVNMNVAMNHSICGGIAETFASGEGLEDSLITHPSMLFQVDEIDTLFNSLKYAKESRAEAIIEKMLRIYSSSNTIYKPRRRAIPKEKLKQPAETVDDDVVVNPYLTILGTAIPKLFYESLSQRLLTNGLMARCMILDAGKRGKAQRAKHIEETDSISRQISIILEYAKDAGNLTFINPKPMIIPATPEATARLDALNEEYNSLYDKYEEKQVTVPMAFWARAFEKVCKLAMIHAVSGNVIEPVITLEAVEWANRFVSFVTEQTLHLTGVYSYENPFDEKCRRAVRYIAENGGSYTHSALLRRMHESSEAFGKIAGTLLENGTIVVDYVAPEGRKAFKIYRLNSSQKDSSAVNNSQGNS